jgi:hypothetical protein
VSRGTSLVAFEPSASIGLRAVLIEPVMTVKRRMILARKLKIFRFWAREIDQKEDLKAIFSGLG